MSRERDCKCPICHDTWKDAASARPCRHQFCLGCILRWTQRSRVCPVCRSLIETLRFSEWGEHNYIQFVITPEESPEINRQEGRAPSHPDENSLRQPTVSTISIPRTGLSPDEQRPAWPEPVGGLLPEVWAALFRRRQNLLNPVRPWLRHRLEGIYWDQWWRIEAAEGRIFHDLCLYGPEAGTFTRRLQSCLQEQTAPLIQGLITVIVGRCSREARRLLGVHRAADQDNSPAASSSSGSSSSQQGTPASGPAGSRVEEEAGASQTRPRRSRRSLRPVPDPSEQEQPQEGPEQPVVAGPCARGSGRSPSARGRGRGRNRSRGGSRGAQKRRVPGPQDGSSSSKKPREGPV